VQDDFGVTVGLEYVSLRHEFSAQLEEVIQLAVINNTATAILIKNRLVACVQVNNTQATYTESYAAPTIVTSAIRAPMPEYVGHPL